MKHDTSGYHTALAKDKNYPSIERLSYNGCLAFKHDIFDGFPDEYKACDLLYVELPWRRGLRVFDERAGVDIRLYRNLCAVLTEIISNNDVPIIISGSNQAEKSLPYPEGKITMSHYGANNWDVLFYHCNPIQSKSTKELIDTIASKYNCIGDFMCGYGVPLQQIYKAGKRFVASDYNGRCIGGIADWLISDDTYQFVKESASKE